MTPYTAIIGFSVFAAVLTLVTGFLWGPQAAFGNNGFLSSMGILPIFVVTNVLLIYFMWTKYRGEFSWWRHGLLPVARRRDVHRPRSGSASCRCRPHRSSYFPFLIAAWVVHRARRHAVHPGAAIPGRLDVIGKTMFIDAEDASARGRRRSHRKPRPNRAPARASLRRRRRPRLLPPAGAGNIATAAAPGPEHGETAMDRMRDKVVLVTGAGSGIGQACAELFAEEGARVVVEDIDGRRRRSASQRASR